MKRVYVCLALVVVCGCTRPEAVPTTLSQAVPAPVIQPCLKPGQRPRPPSRLVEDQPAPPATLTEMVGRLRAKLKEWQDSYGPTADELLTACEKVKEGGTP